MPLVLSPSMARISSPGWMPARAAGVSSTGETTTSASPALHHVQPQPAELAGGVDLHLLEDLGRHEDGVRVEGVQHSLDRPVDELPLVHPLHVVVLHVGEHPGEELQLLVGGVLGGEARRGSGGGGARRPARPRRSTRAVRARCRPERSREAGRPAVPSGVRPARHARLAPLRRRSGRPPSSRSGSTPGTLTFNTYSYYPTTDESTPAAGAPGAPHHPPDRPLPRGHPAGRWGSRRASATSWPTWPSPAPARWASCTRPSPTSARR